MHAKLWQYHSENMWQCVCVMSLRITANINKEVSELQSGFRSGMGRREGIFNLRSICERALEVGKEVYMCFID